MTVTPEEIDAALEAVRAIDGPASIGSQEVVTAALSAAFPLIEARTKAEALREAADLVLASEWWHERTDINFSDRVRTWLRARARAATLQEEQR